MPDRHVSGRHGALSAQQPAMLAPSSCRARASRHFTMYASLLTLRFLRTIAVRKAGLVAAVSAKFTAMPMFLKGFESSAIQTHPGCEGQEMTSFVCCAVKDETSLGSRAWNLSLTPASLSPDVRLTSTADLLSIDSLAAPNQTGSNFNPLLKPSMFQMRPVPAQARMTAWEQNNSKSLGFTFEVFMSC